MFITFLFNLSEETDWKNKIANKLEGHQTNLTKLTPGTQIIFKK